jgi:LCP family protein required for cell wall assembly
MKPTEIQPIDSAAKRTGPRADRLTPLLIWVTFFLVAALAAIGADLWLRPTSNGPVAQAIGVTPSTSTSPPSTPSAIALTIAPTNPILVSTAKVDAAPSTPPACVPPDDWGIHVVQPGNTLYSLARRYETSVDTLMQVNCLNTHTIFSGQRLYIPSPPATPTPEALLAAQQPSPASTSRPDALTTPIGDGTNGATLSPTLTPLPAFPITIPDRYLNIVLLGSDKRPGSGAWRTDSMIVVSVDTSNNVVRLLSIPRDLWVYIPGHGYNRVNTADLWGELAKKGSGPDRVKQTIHHNLGIPIHYYVRIDFQGFIQIIDTVGGIDVDVDCALSDIKLTAGMHHMNGKQALRYARSRYSTSDFDRGRRQRKVLMALWDQALTLDIIPKLPQLWWTMGNSFQTDLTLDQVINLAYVGVQLKPQHILSRAIGPSHVQSWMTPQGASVLLPNHEKIRPMLESFYAAVDPAQLDGEGKRVWVLNGSQRKDADQLAAAALRWVGFKMTAAGPADHQDYAQTQIVVHAGGTAAAGQIAQTLRVPAAIIREQPDPSSPVDIQVVLGSDYNPCRR